MASGSSSGRGGSGAKSFDFGSDDVVCSYDDFDPQDPSNGRRSDHSSKDFYENRMRRPLMNVYGQEDLSKDDVIFAVEKCMKKYADNLLRFLEGISGRLSQLEVHCRKLEGSVGELRSDFLQDQTEAGAKLKALEKHLLEVQRSVQILRDKQELAETQKELAKLQLSKKDPTNIAHTKQSEQGTEPSISEARKHDNTDDVPNQHLALALPHQVTPSTLSARASEPNQSYKGPALQQPAPTSQSMQQDHYIMNQAGTFYSQQMQPEYQYMQPMPKAQDLCAQQPQQQPQVLNQPQPQPQAMPQYQQKWLQHVPQQMVQPQAPPSQPQVRPQTPPSYPPYAPNLSANPVPKTFPGNTSAQIPYSANLPSSGNRPEAMPSAYVGSGGSVPQPLQPQFQTNQTSFHPRYAPDAPQSNIQGYNAMYTTDGSRGAHPQNLQPGSYPPGNSVLHHPGPQLVHSHPFGEMIEKAVSMGYPRDHVAGVIHRMGESGQPIDFNALLDRLNARSATATPRVWSG